jgi:hypothetical protein
MPIAGTIAGISFRESIAATSNVVLDVLLPSFRAGSPIDSDPVFLLVCEWLAAEVGAQMTSFIAGRSEYYVTTSSVNALSSPTIAGGHTIVETGAGTHTVRLTVTNNGTDVLWLRMRAELFALHVATT